MVFYLFCMAYFYGPYVHHVDVAKLGTVDDF